MTFRPAGTETAEALRHRMVSSIVRDGDLRSAQWRRVFEATPRHVLVPRFYRRAPHGAHSRYEVVDGVRSEHRQAWLAGVYSNATLITRLRKGDTGAPTSTGTMPGLLALMLEALDIRDRQTVLEIGTGTGYAAALLAERLGSERVVSVDIDERVVEDARSRLAAAGYGPTLAAADGAGGYPAGAPYDRIIATCGLTHVPFPWLGQMRAGGKILVPIAAGLAIVDVHSADRASGRFLADPAYFMPLRAEPRPRTATPAPPAAGADSVTRAAELSAQIVDDNTFRFLLEVALPGLRHAGTSGESDLILYHDDGSAAHLTAGGSVTQHGPRRLWDEVERLYRQWERLGKPARERFGLTIRPGLQQVWLDTGQVWQLPLTSGG